MEESRKILSLPELRIDATAVRVPTEACHGESVNVECERSASADEVRAAWRGMPGLEVLDDPARKAYPTGRHGAGRDPVYVGRLRADRSALHAWSFWAISDNLRKGAALNAVQIGEIWMKHAS
jgi:aspartate-semialdehyde dehydrogenase